MIYPSRSSAEHAEVSLVRLLRPLASFALVATVIAAAMSPAVHAGSRERYPQHRAAARLQPSHSHVSARAHTSSARLSSTRRPVTRSKRASSSHERASAVRSHTEKSFAVSARGRRMGITARRRTSETAHVRRSSRSSAAADVAVAHRALASTPLVAASPVVRPESGVYASGESSPAGDVRSSSIPDTDSLAPLSTSEMAQAAVQPHVFPMYTRSGRLIVPPPLRGSREILVHQNEMADAAGLERIQNDDQLDRLRDSHRLVQLASTSSLRVNPELPENRRAARPWTAKFAADIARAYYARFGQPLELNSAVRTISYQLRLQRVNGNAADVSGETASPHLTGQAIDFGKRGMSMAEIAWMRMYLAPLMQAGMIDVEEEFQQACFHISVYRNYPGTRRADLAQASTHRSTVASDAASSFDSER